MSVSSSVAISVENISKCYRIGLKQKKHDSVVSALIDLIKSPLVNYRRYRSLYKFADTDPNEEHEGQQNDVDMIWALKDVSLTVQRGEVLGVIGKNGAGKSTLLKILTKITYPTRGRACIRGRVSSLLEVGTGFHQELTGRENVYLNGTVLGMTKKEIDGKFDEIVAFSGVERFIDTPVKRYSSGMAVRLAFAVAAHLEPEILLVDEVLAVGDAAFQKKCLGKMSAVAREGRTVLFVSHNMGAVTQLCQRTILLEGGRITMDGLSSDVVLAYLTEGASGQQEWHNPEGRRPDLETQIQSVRLLSETGQSCALFPFSSPFNIEITHDVFHPVRDLSVTYYLFDSQGTLVFESMDTDMPEWKGRHREPGRYVAVCSLPGSFLKPGHYHLSVMAFIERIKIIDRHEGVVSFDVSEVGYGSNPKRYGIIAPVFRWNVTSSDYLDTSLSDTPESLSHSVQTR